mmetsp:Transcript_104458/g.301149  ORF Transcript_104458/g.301149 Transcript_104458/m.301149 type:complete len:160 (+) Transcript_104458:150-629(+)
MLPPPPTPEEEELEEFEVEFFAAAAEGDAAGLNILLEANDDFDVNALIEGGDDEGMTALMVAAKNEKVNCVKLLIGVEGVDLDLTDEKGRTALIWAVDTNDDLDCIKALIEADCNLDIRSKKDASQRQSGGTALHQAKEDGNTEVVELLEEAGAADYGP